MLLTLKLQISSYSSHSWKLQDLGSTSWISSEENSGIFPEELEPRKQDFHGSYRVAENAAKQ